MSRAGCASRLTAVSRPPRSSRAAIRTPTTASRPEPPSSICRRPAAGRPRAVRRHGGTARRFKAEDFNFWGRDVCADSDTFYATLDTAGVSYLVKGSVRKRRRRCHGRTSSARRSRPTTPASRSRSASALARSAGGRLTILSLDTMAETIVSRETRSVDDQVEWLDDQRVVYHLSSCDHVRRPVVRARRQQQPAGADPDVRLFADSCPLDEQRVFVFAAGARAPVFRPSRRVLESGAEAGQDRGAFAGGPADGGLHGVHRFVRRVGEIGEQTVRALDLGGGERRRARRRRGRWRSGARRAASAPARPGRPAASSRRARRPGGDEHADLHDGHRRASRRR